MVVPAGTRPSSGVGLVARLENEAKKSVRAVEAEARAVEAEAASIEQRLASSLAGGAPARQRSPGSGGAARWPWRQCGHLAPGCGPDYIPVGQKNVRLWATGNQVANEVREDPVVTMEEGIPVLLYHPVHRVFERRVLKVDNKLHFMYMLAEAASLHGSSQPGKCQDPITMRLHQITNVWDAADAMRICEAVGVSDSHLTIDSAVVVQFGDKEQAVPSLEKIFVFMAAPQQKLRACVEACWVSCGVDVEEEAEPKPRKATPRAQVKVKPKPKGPRARISGVLLRDVKQVFDREQSVFHLEVLLKPDNRPVTIGANTCTPARAEEEALRAASEAGHNLAAIDAARVSFVLRDVSALREWATARVPAAFDGKLWDFLPDERGLAAVVHRNDEFREAMAELQAVDEGPTNDVYGEASVRSSLRALQQLMQLEAKFADLVDSGRALGLVTSDTLSVVTLGHKFINNRAAETLPAIADAKPSTAAPLDEPRPEADLPPTLDPREATPDARGAPAPLGILGDALESAEAQQQADPAAWARPPAPVVRPLQLNGPGFPRPADNRPEPPLHNDGWARVGPESTEKAMRADEDHPRSRCSPAFCGSDRRGPDVDDQSLAACAGLRGSGKDCAVQ